MYLPQLVFVQNSCRCRDMRSARVEPDERWVEAIDLVKSKRSEDGPSPV